jgi:capsular polysaccharide biosynthesis protein
MAICMGLRMLDDWTPKNDGNLNPSWRPRYLFGTTSLWRYRQMICLFGASFLVASLLFAAGRPMTYTASTQLLIYNRQLMQGPESVISPAGADTPLLESTIEIFRSRRVLTRVIEALRLDEDREFTSDGPLLWGLARNWFAMPEDTSVGEHRLAFERTLEFVRRGLAISRVGPSHTILVNFSSSDPNKSALIANEIVQSASQTLTNPDATSLRAPLLRERFHGLGPNVYAISTADPPIRPDPQRLILIVVASSLAGLGLGAILALLTDFLDGTIRSPEQVEYFLDLECLAVVPRVSHGPMHPTQMKTPGDNLIEPWSDPAPGLSANDHVILDRLNRAQVVIDSIRRRLRCIGVTSAVPGEGVTSIALNLAQLSARRGKRVLIVDGIGRNRPPSWSGGNEHCPSATRPGLRALFGAHFTADAGPGVDISSIGDPTTAETDAAYWMRLDETLRQSTSSYDLVIADLPALASDPQLVQIAARSLDGLLLVVKWGGTDAELIRRRLGLLGETCSKFVGVVLNMSDQGLLGGYGDKLTEAEAAITARRSIRGARAAGPADLACA